MPSKAEITEFYERLEKFDWTYHFSDDHFVWRAGVEAEKELVTEIRKYPLFAEMAEEYKGYIFSGPAYNTERPPKPKLEEYLLEATEE